MTKLLGPTIHAAPFVRAVVILLLISGSVRSQEIIDQHVRADMLKKRDGLVAHIKTPYNDMFIEKFGPYLALSTRYKRNTYLESMVNLRDPDEMPVPYAPLMTVGLVYPVNVQRVLMVGLGGGSISTYLGRAMTSLQIDVVELDPGVVEVAKKYFGLREGGNLRIIEGDGRVYLERYQERYDLILLDAYRELGVPFNLLTREFYSLVKDHLTPGGVVALNVYARTTLYYDTLVTLKKVFDTVRVYPNQKFRGAAQSIVIAIAGTPAEDKILMERANALQKLHHFRYPLPALVQKKSRDHQRIGEILIDDSAPVNLYEATQKPRKKP